MEFEAWYRENEESIEQEKENRGFIGALEMAYNAALFNVEGHLNEVNKNAGTIVDYGNSLIQGSDILRKQSIETLETIISTFKAGSNGPEEALKYTEEKLEDMKRLYKESFLKWCYDQAGWENN